MRRVLMIHVSRTGGTSIRNRLIKWDQYQKAINLRWFQTGLRKFDHTKRFIMLNHGLPHHLTDAGIVSEEWLRGCWKVAFVRNPWDRLVSLFFSLRKIRLPRGENVGSNSFLLDFGKFIREVTNRDSPWLRFESMKTTFWYGQSQLHWFQDGIDFTGRFERLDQDWRHLSNEMGIEYKPLPHAHNTDPPQHYSHFYDQELRELVARDRAEVIDRFEYTFEEE